MRAVALAQQGLSRSIVIGWAFGAFPQGLAHYAFSVLFFRYLIDTVALGAGLVGLLFALNKIYDGVIDTGIGHVSDRLHTPIGGRLPLMLTGAVLLAVSLIVMFSVPLGAATPFKLMWTAAGLFLFSTGFSLFAIPWMAIPAEATNAFDERTRMMSWRTLFAAAGHGVGSLLGPGVLAAAGLLMLAYDQMGRLLALLCLIGAVAVCFLVRRVRWHPPETVERPPLLAQLRLTVSNQALTALVLLKAALYFASAMHAAALAIFVTHVMRVSDVWLAGSSIAAAIAAVCSQPFWQGLSRRLGKRRALAAGLAWYSLAMAAFSLLRPGLPSASLVAASAIIGFGSGGAFVLAQSLLPDVIEYDTLRTGMRRGGAIAGAASFLETSSAALGVLALGLILAGAGYISGGAGADGQPASALLAIRACCGVLAAASAAMGLWALSRYHLTEGRLMTLRAGVSEAADRPAGESA